MTCEGVTKIEILIQARQRAEGMGGFPGGMPGGMSGGMPGGMPGGGGMSDS